jgi:type I restriction enzyme S subunit
MGGDLHEWRDCRLGDVLELKRGYDLPSQHRQPGSVPIVSSSGPSGFHSEARVKAPGVVTGRYGTLGEVFFVTRDFWPLNTTLYVRDFKGSDPKFISYFLKTIDFYSCSDKAAVPGVNRNHLHDLPVRVPPLGEQRAIARILGALDHKIDLNRKMNATLEAMARALFKSWFVDFDPVRAKAEGGAPSGMDAETAKLFPSEFVESESKPLPKGWRYGSIGEFVELQRGTTYKSALKGLPGPVLLGLGAIQRNGGFRDDKLLTYGGDSPEKLFVYPGELFASLKDVTQSADLLGAVARVPRHVARGRLTQDTVKLQVTGTIDIGEVLYRALLTDECREHCRQHATGTTNLGLSREDFLSCPIVVAAAPVLDAFNRSIRSLTLRAEFAAVESRTLARIRDDLLPRLLSGELSIVHAGREVETVA